MKTTLGQLLINEALPEDMRNYKRRWDRMTTRQVMREVAKKHPDLYRDVSKKLLQVGQSAAVTGNISFSLRDFLAPDYKTQRLRMLKRQLQGVEDNRDLTPDQKKKQVLKLLGKEVQPMIDTVMKEALGKGNRLAGLVRSGAKGSAGQFNTTIGSPLLFLDHKDEPVPMPVFSSVSDGLDPAEYWISSYGTRKGTIATKFSTQEAGYFGKKLALALQRGVITEDDCETKNGITMDGEEPENVGTVLQLPVKNFPAGTVIEPEHLKLFKGKKIVVRSPITCQAQRGLCAHCAGIRETGQFPEVGDNIGVSAAMVLGEQLSQTMLNVKHGGGAAGKRGYSFEDIERLFEMPKQSISAAAVAQVDGIVKQIKKAPAGGAYIVVGEREHWIPSVDDTKVKVGQHVEAGDVLSFGIPNPREIARFRGIGDARMEFMHSLREVAGRAVTRRNAELISRYLVSHVQVNDAAGLDGALPGDVVRYDDLVRGYRARKGSKPSPVAVARGKYLEQPVLHYTIGTKLNNRMISDLKKRGVSSILTNEQPPSFDPDVQRMYAHSQMDRDWMSRLGGYHLKDSLLMGVHRGDVSQAPSTSFVPSIAKGIEFGDQIQDKGLY